MSTPTIPAPDLKSKFPKRTNARNAIYQALRESQYLALRSVQVEHDDGRLLLKGRVASYYLKQVAQTRAADAAPGLLVVNEIEVS